MFAATLLLSMLAGFLAAVAAAGPPFPERPAGTHIVDDAEVFNRPPEAGVEEGLRAFLDSRGVDIVVLTQVKGTARDQAAADADAQALLKQWDVGGGDGQGAVMLWDFDRQTSRAFVSVALSDGLRAMVDEQALAAQVEASMRDSLGSDDWLNALNRGVFTLTAAIPGTPVATVPPEASQAPGPTHAPGASPTPRPTRPPIVPDLPSAPAGPPYPAPITGLRVYDYAGVLSPATRLRAAGVIADIEARTGAQVIVYTQVKPESDTPALAADDARALIDQYGVGRKGFDDGLAIMFDLEDNKCHGQVQLYAAPGYEASYLTNADRQAIYQDDMLPHLRNACDVAGSLDLALDAALLKIDAATTAERASQLQLARQVDAAAGLVLAPLLLIGLVGWAGWSWMRYGRDPEYIDDASVLMPAPPPGLTPAAAAVVLDGRVNRHALTTALIDLAGRGELRFRQPSASGRTTLDVLEPDKADPRDPPEPEHAAGRAGGPGAHPPAGAPGRCGLARCRPADRLRVDHPRVRQAAGCRGRDLGLVSRGPRPVDRTLVLPGGPGARPGHHRRGHRVEPAEQRPAARGRRPHRRVDRDVRAGACHAPADDVGGHGLRLARRVSSDPGADARRGAFDG